MAVRQGLLTARRTAASAIGRPGCDRSLLGAQPRNRALFSVGLAFAATSLLVPTSARAETPPYELSYTAPTGCPSEKRVLAEVRANVRDAASGAGARIELSITADDSGFAGLLVAFDRDGNQGQRRIQGPTCSEVSQTLAFLAALAIELGGRVEPETEPEPPPSAAPVAPAPPPARPAAAPTKPPPPAAAPGAWRAGLVLGAGLRGGLAPSARPAAELGLDYAASGARLLAPSLRALVVGSLSRISQNDGDAKLSLVAGRLEGCPVRVGGLSVALRPCVGVELGAVFARGELDGGRSVVQRWGSSEASLRLEAWLAPQVFLELSGAAVVPFFHTRYFFVPERIIYVVPGLTARAGLLAGFRF